MTTAKPIARVSLLAMMIVGAGGAAAQQFAPVFDEYPAKVEKGGSAAPRYVGDAAWARDFRTRIKNGIAKGTTFGGHYSMVEFGCGASCLIALAVDRKTGKIIRFPLGGEDNPYMELRYRANSRLVQANWQDDDQSECVQEFYQVKADGFARVSGTRTPLPQGGSYCEAE